MADLLERNFAGLLLRIDRAMCIGTGNCVKVAPEVFVIDDTGVVTFRPDAVAVERERMVEACQVCPVDALAAIDEEGRRLAP